MCSPSGGAYALYTEELTRESPPWNAGEIFKNIKHNFHLLCFERRRVELLQIAGTELLELQENLGNFVGHAIY